MVVTSGAGRAACYCELCLVLLLFCRRQQDIFIQMWCVRAYIQGVILIGYDQLDDPIMWQYLDIQELYGRNI